MNPLEEVDIGTRTRRVCSVCLKKEAPYRCPKCYVAYCSKNCYESHNSSCLEQFTESFTESLRNVFATETEKRRMQELLQRHWNEDAEAECLDSEDDNEKLEEALQRLEFDEPEEVFSSLPERFQRKFQRLLANGDIEDLVEVWKPWWEEEEPIIVEVFEQGSSQAGRRDGESELANSEQVKIQLKQEPSETLNLHILEVCYAYCYCMRFFNGDLEVDYYDSFQCLLAISKVLSEDCRYLTISEVLRSVLYNSQEDVYFSNSRDFALLVLRDTRKVVNKGCKGILRALDETEALARTVRVELKKDKHNRDWFKTAFKVEKKIEYFKFFVRSRWKETWTRCFDEYLELFEQEQKKVSQEAAGFRS